MSTLSTFRQLTIPTVGGDTGIWGGELNTSLNALDTILGPGIQLFSSNGNNVTLSSSQCQQGSIFVDNTSTSPFQLNIPASNGGYGIYCINNTNGSNQICKVTAGSSIGGGGIAISIQPQVTRMIRLDGTNAFFAEYQYASLVGATDAGTITPSSGEKIRITTGFGLQLQQFTVNSDQSSASGNWSLLCFSASSPGGQALSVSPAISGGSNSGVMQDYIPYLATVIFTLNSPANFTKSSCNLLGYKL